MTFLASSTLPYARYGYLLHSCGLGPILSSFLTGGYLVLKLGDLLAGVKLLLQAARLATRRGAMYGTYVGQAAGGGSGGGRTGRWNGPGQQQPAEPRRRQVPAGPLSEVLPGQGPSPEAAPGCGPDASSAGGGGGSGAAAGGDPEDMELGRVESGDGGACPVCHVGVEGAVSWSCSTTVLPQRGWSILGWLVCSGLVLGQ